MNDRSLYGMALILFFSYQKTPATAGTAPKILARNSPTN